MIVTCLCSPPCSIRPPLRSPMNCRHSAPQNEPPSISTARSPPLSSLRSLPQSVAGPLPKKESNRHKESCDETSSYLCSAISLPMSDEAPEDVDCKVPAVSEASWRYTSSWTTTRVVYGGRADHRAKKVTTCLRKKPRMRGRIPVCEGSVFFT
eukprot:585436-Hanusia_phi.AAC.3